MVHILFSWLYFPLDAGYRHLVFGTLPFQNFALQELYPYRVSWLEKAKIFLILVRLDYVQIYVNFLFRRDVHAFYLSVIFIQHG